MVSTYRDEPVLVIGAAGFLGSLLTRRLLDAGALVTAADLDGDRCRALVDGTPTARAIAVDLTKPDAPAALVRDASPVVTFNAAGYGVRPSQTDDAMHRALNADLPCALVEALADAPASRWPGPRLVHFGSGAEYGNCGGDLEELTRATPTSQYGRWKLAGTDGVRQRADALSVRTVTARIFTVYGNNEPPGRLLPTLMRAADARDAIDLSDGTQQRDFVFAGDVIEALLRLGIHRRGDGGALGETVNVASGQLHTVREFVEIAAGELGLDRALLRFGVLPARPWEMAHLPVNTNRLRRLTGWTPSVSIAEGVRRTVAFLER